MAVLNPNNWHWVDKNTLPWTKDYFNQRLTNYEITSKDGKHTIKVTKVSSISGDSNVSQRKGKPICYFDLKLDMSVAIVNDEEEEDKTGTIVVPEFMHDDEDFEINATGFNSEGNHLVKSDFIPALRLYLLQYQKDLLKNHSQDLQHGSD